MVCPLNHATVSSSAAWLGQSCQRSQGSGQGHAVDLARAEARKLGDHGRPRQHLFDQRQQAAPLRVRIAQGRDQRLVDLVGLARRRFDQVQAGAGDQEVLAQRPPRRQLDEMALAKAVVADHGQHVAAALAAAVERTVQRHALRLQPDRQRLGILHRHDPQAQRLQRLARAELVGVERNPHLGLGQRRRRRHHGAVRLGAELLGRQAEAPPGGKEHLPLVAAHVGLEQLARTKMWMVDCLLCHRSPPLVRTLLCVGQQVECVALPLDQRLRHLLCQPGLALFLLAIPFRDQRLDEETAVADRQKGIARGG